jgi:uncharacterized protein YndB with AHSA1/START domain
MSSVRRWALCAALGPLAGCGPSLVALRGWAEQAQLQPDAPVHAESRVVVDAPIELVWHIFTGVAAWPRWNRDAPAAKLDGALAVGTQLSYGSGARHHLTIARVDPPTRFVFYGTLSGYKGITIWDFQAIGPTSTAVLVRESTDGPGIRLFYGDKQLARHLASWTERLKAEAERQLASMPH